MTFTGQVCGHILIVLSAPHDGEDSLQVSLWLTCLTCRSFLLRRVSMRNQRTEPQPEQVVNPERFLYLLIKKSIMQLLTMKYKGEQRKTL